MLPAKSDLELPLLLEIVGAGGSITIREAYERLKHHFPSLNQDDLDATWGHGENTWETLIRLTRQNLIEGGDLSGASPRGVWTISHQGRNRVKAESRRSFGLPPSPSA